MFTSAAGTKQDKGESMDLRVLTRYGELSEEYATSIAGDAQACIGRTGFGPRDGVRGSLGRARAAGSHPS